MPIWSKSPIRVMTPREELLGGSDESHEIVFSDFVTKVECYLLLNSFCILCSSVSHQHQQQVLPCLQKAMGQTRAIKALPHHSRLPMEENEDINVEDEVKDMVSEDVQTGGHNSDKQQDLKEKAIPQGTHV